MIPKIIHQIWIGPLRAPERWMQTWREKHPAKNGWEYRLWSNIDLMYGSWINAAKIDAMPELNGKADIMRWEILLAHGGVLVDADSECVEALDPHFFRHKAFACWEHELCRPGLIAAGYVGSVPGSPLMRKLVDGVTQAELSGKRAWQTVGPQLLTDLADDSLYVYPSRTFIPKHFSGAEAPGNSKIYAKQYWGSTLGYDQLGR